MIRDTMREREVAARVVECPGCRVEYALNFTEPQLRELVDEHARASGSNHVVAAKLGLNEKTIRRLRNGIAVKPITLLRLDLFYQEQHGLLERLRYRMEKPPNTGARLFVTMPGASAPWLHIRRRAPGT
jgi:hypothetical protein